MSDVKVTGICHIISMKADNIEIVVKPGNWQTPGKAARWNWQVPAEATREVFGTGRDFGTRAKGP
jgi:hypothetical protein